MARPISNRRMRRLERDVREAAEEHGAETVLEVLEATLRSLRRGSGAAGERPRSADYDSAEEFRAAMRSWRERRATEVGPAIRRGRTPGVLTKDL